ncbi:PmoA family protein [Maribacter sp. HTCC2170]|uniref:DUF6807 domain-containing protein n=1 Tax=Maribacter sp. (strain HTCC2170 / KCCM 42371) TaxID=313603 RepID=UPI00006B4918|nr:PmoA family protein [Maribacter sp. HTCC2170]EAR00906.1 hypothetical protein FB2170_09051 [Maribacter sp. HTCC2170]
MRYIFLFCSFITLLSCKAEKEIYRFEIQDGDGFLQSSPIFLDTEIRGNEDYSQLKLIQNNVTIPFQVDENKLWFLHTPRGGTYSFEKIESGVNDESVLSTFKKNGNLQLVKGNDPLLTYRYQMTYPPEGVDTIFKKSGYIHPLLSPKGDTLTRIQPPDHFHHYGIWGPWTHTQIKGEQVDFWNLGDGKGTVLFEEFNNTTTGEVFAGFNATQEHIDFITGSSPQNALDEKLDVKLWDLGRSDRYMFDYTSTFSSPLKDGIIFEAYRYGGGIGMRFDERWHKDNCTVLTSEGHDRLTADGTNAKWCIVKGESSDGNGTNGILFMSHPGNRMHPEPMRIWPIDGNNGRGDMFFEFCPIRHKEWKIEPNKDYKLTYRMVVFEGDLTAEEAEGYWKIFANNPKSEILN